MAELQQRDTPRERAPRRRSHAPGRREGEAGRPDAAAERPDRASERSDRASERPDVAAERSEAEGERPEPAEEPQTPKKPFEQVARSVVGYALVFVALAGYFVWLASQMGQGAQTGAAPLIVVFAAAALGLAMAGLALLITRRDRGK